MRIIETFVSFPQVKMCIDLQDAKFAMLFSNRFQKSKRCTMITTQYTYQLISFKQDLCLFIHPVVKKQASLIHFFQGFCHKLVGLHFFTF